MKSLRRIVLSLATLAVLLAVLGGCVWWSIHTAWFAQLLRNRIVSSLEKTTGGRVELGAFTFNPDTLHAKILGLVIHGTEPAGSSPLLSVAAADVGLKILSFWQQDVDVTSVFIDRPEIHLIVNAGGVTNLPVARTPSAQSPLEQLLHLSVKHLQVNQGVVAINDRRVPFQFVAQNTRLALDYSRAGPSYGVSLAADLVQPLPLRVSSSGRLYRDHADIENLILATGNKGSTLQLAGRIDHFAQPAVHLSTQAALSIDELAHFAGIDQFLQSGQLAVKGSGDYRSDSKQFTFHGNAEAHGVAFVSPGFTLRGMTATSVVLANNGGIVLQQAHAAARGAHFSGDGSIRAYRFLQIQGQVSQVQLTEVGAYLTSQPFPWSGGVHGTAHASARLGDAQPDFIIGANADIDPETSGIPTSGHVDVTYYNRSGKVEFGNSTLTLPHSQATFQGALDTDLSLNLQTTGLSDLQPLVPILGLRLQPSDLPQFAPGGRGQFSGTLRDLIHQPLIQGDTALTHVKLRNFSLDGLSGQVALSASEFSAAKVQLAAAGTNLTGSAAVQLKNWTLSNDSPIRVSARFANLDVPRTVALVTSNSFPVMQGVASGLLNLTGSLRNPSGNASLHLLNLDAFGENLNQVELDASLLGNRLQLSQGKVQAGQASLSFSVGYLHNPDDWSTGDVDLKADSNGFPLSSLATLRKFVPALNGRAELHLNTVGKLRSNSFEPLQMNGSVQIQGVALNGRQLGNLSMTAATRDKMIDFKYSGDLRETKFQGVAQARLVAGTPIRGDVQLERISLAMARSLASDTKISLPLDGYLKGSLAFDGALEEPARLHARATIDELQISSLPRLLAANAPPDIVLSNKDPVILDVSNGILSISKFEIAGRETSVAITGSAPLKGDQPLAIKAVGRADLALFTLFDPNVRSSGSSELAANIAGPISAPSVTGALKVSNGAFFLTGVPNGLSDVDGTVVFSRNRATIQKMTAHSGGGNISLSGSLSFGEGSPLVYHLEAAARDVRVRYANSISVTGNSDLRLSGTSASSLFSGTLTVTRVVFTPNADAGNLLAAASSYTSPPSNPQDFLSGLHLDVGVESSPNLQVSTNLSRDVEAEIRLRLRGTPDHPIVLGSITANQGDIKIFGTRFSLNRGEVSFVNAVRVEPVLDLDLETQARGVTVDITVSGTPSKLNFNYRSDPPLQPRDIIALLTVGRAPNVGSTSNAQGASDVSALTSGVNSVLGSAISPVSNRLSKLFGVTNIRIDPFVQGITNTPQARLSVEQQISRDVTVTYITNLSQTSEQIFRFEWALSRQFSIVAIRDDNGEFGIDFQIKKRFK